MKQSQTDAESEALRVYQKYWESYLQGDLDAFSSTIDDRFEMIGTSEGEVCHSKADGIAFYKAQMAEVVGKVEMRNSQTTSVSLDPLVLINEACDIYVKTDEGWNFYSKLRLSTLLKETSEGCKIVQQHGSLPDMRVGDGETMAIEKISKENLELRDAIKRRTIELEQKNQELEVEAALERVRARTMAMQKSDELGEVATVLFSELNSLVDDLWTCGFVFCEESRPEDEWWLSLANGLIQPFFLPNVGDFTHEALYKGWENGEAYRTVTLENEMLKQHYDWLMNIPIARQIFDEMEGSGIPRPNWQRLHAAYFKTGYLVVITEIPCKEEEIFKRFAQVFDLTYTRFLDLKKAEAQAREAEIQLALERVRARTMAMQHSSELADAAAILFQQIKSLGIDTYTSGFNIWEEEQNTLESWMSNPTGKLNPKFIFPASEYGQHLKFYQKWKSKTEFIEDDLSGEKIVEHYKYLRSFPLLDEALAIAESSGIQTPDRQVHNVAFFSHGYLLFVTLEPKPEFQDLFIRFAKVFDQTYTRFLDLQKAEAQAREAQIEVAVERVRAKALAMHKSEEIISVNKVLMQELGKLQISGVISTTIYQKEEDGRIRFWDLTSMEETEDGEPLIMDQYLRLEECPDFLWFQRMFRSKEKYSIVEQDRDELKRSLEWVMQSVNEEVALSMIAFFEETNSWHIWHPRVLLDQGIMNIDLIQSPPAEVETILIKMGAAFDLAHKRFLDLQKAEAQAREAQIEAALEKVRSRTMAMQSSEELADAAYVLFEQLKSLGVTHERINIGIVNEESQTIDFWITEQGGDKLNTKFSGRISEPTTISKAYAAWKHGEKSLMIDLQGEELKSWLSYLSDELKIPFNKSFLHDRRVQTAGFFSKGMLILTSPEPLQQEALYLLEKFAGVFDLTYTRFSDLKLAEAQALQAEKDLVEIKIARQKAEEALAELKSTQAQLIQQEKLASLGQLTAGIAHEIKNPLNFVNNFSEVSMEMIGETLEEMEKREARDEILIRENLEDIQSNLQKIHEHGSRANGIVTSMLQHSRGGSGKKEPTDLNALIKEYVNLSFHGMRAGKNPIDVEIELDLDEAVKEIPLVREDFTRVIINLCNNAFDAMRQKFNSELKIMNSELYHPKLTVRTKSEKDHILISVADNGPGIPDDIKDKILQPFFTTKKGTEGTGLGLSITHDIVKAHGGELEIATSINKGTNFTIRLNR